MIIFLKHTLCSFLILIPATQTLQNNITRNPERQITEPSNNEIEVIAENSEKSTITDPKEEEERPRVITEEFPDGILEYFTNPEFQDDERLDLPNSYYESNDDLCKKSVFEFEKYLPLMVQREKLKIKKRATLIEDIMSLPTDTIYFQAGTLLLKSLEMKDIKNPKNTNKLIEFLRQKNISEDNFNRHNYYYFLFTSKGENKRLISACPGKKEVKIEFPAEAILKEDIEKDDEVLETSFEFDKEAVFSSNEDDDIKSTPASPEHSDSKKNTSLSSSPRCSKSEEFLPATEEIPTEQATSSLNPSATVATSKAKQSPTQSKSSLYKKIKKKISSRLNSTLSRFLSNEISQPENKQLSASKIKKKENPETIEIKNTFKGRVFEKRGIAIQGDEYNPFNFPCTTELKPTYVKENSAQYADIYYAGYLVDFERPISPLVVHLLKVDTTTLWLHIGHLLMDRETKDTYSMFNYVPYYQTVLLMQNIPIYTDYTADENTVGSLEYYTRMYSKENQEKVFESFGNREKFFDPNKSLVLVEQELMDQKSAPIMTHKRAALDYINIAPMYKIIKDTTWSKVENVVLKVPFITNASTVMFVTGTYGSLKINNSTKGVYLDKDGDWNGTKRIKVPYAFYKIMHIEYSSPRLGDFIADHLKFFFSIVIVTHNDPFETNPEIICDTPLDCGSVGWKKVEQKDPKFGYTYCCKWTSKFSEDMKITPMYASLMPKEVLDLRTLWFVEVSQASNPLQRDELAIIKQLKELSTIRNDPIHEP